MQACPFHAHRRKYPVILALLVFSLLILLRSGASALTPEEQKAAKKVAMYKATYPLIKDTDLQPHIQYLSSLGSRVAGYPGNVKAADYVAAQFDKIGLDDVSASKRDYKEEFQVAVPIIKRAGTYLQVKEGAGGAPLDLYPLWPNVVRTSRQPAGGIEVPLIYGGKGSLLEFNGQKVKGAAVLMEFDTGGNWLNAPRLGAAAVIFIAPEQIDAGAERGEAENKFLKIPIDIPRYWIKRKDAWPLLARLKTQPELKVNIKCDMNWEKKTSWNIIGEIRGSDPKLRDEVVYIESYYDSMSIVPELAPGAESAAGIATLIEMAKFFKAHPPARTVRFLATGAHFISLTGIRSYLSQHIKDLTEGVWRSKPAKFLGFIPYTKDWQEKQKINLFCALDLSSHSPRVGLFYTGMYYGYGGNTNFSDLARACREDADKVIGNFPEAAGSFVDCVNPTAGRPWSTFIVGKVALDNEPVTLGGSRGICFLTTDDSRSLVDTPFDLPEQVDVTNLTRQARMLACILQQIGADPEMPVEKEPIFTRMGLSEGFALLKGLAVAFVPKEGIIPTTPVPGALVVLRTANSTLMGVRSDQVEMVDRKGGFSFDGVATINTVGRGRQTYVEAYHLDPDSGAIDYAPEQGSEGGKNYPTSFTLTKGVSERTIVIFPCYSVAIYDLVDPQSLTTLRSMTVLDGESDAEPRSYGFTISHPEAWMSHVEDVALVFAKRDTRPTEKAAAKDWKPIYPRIKVIMSMGPAAIRLLLLNADTIDNDRPTGQGYLITKSMAIENTPLAVAQDMHALDQKRIEKLQKFNIVNANVMELHDQAQKYIIQAQKALATEDYDSLNSLARAAWGYESRAYPAIQATNDDVVKGVIFYLALMLPFCFFMERLLVAAPDLKRQITWIVIIFALTCAVFSRIHPAFRISSNPWIVPLAFVMLALSILVISLVLMKFEAQLRALQQKMGGIHRADIGRLGVAAAAFSLGISNMRKRRARTIFTCITLITLTFTVLSFTSVVTTTRFNVRRSDGVPRYQGLMIRNAKWTPLEDSAYRIINDEFGSTRAVAPRAWFFTSTTNEQSFVSISTNKSNKIYNSRALVGMVPEEAKVTRFDQALEWGSWFKPGDKNVCILPSGMADYFNIGVKDIGRAKIYVGGVPFTLIGVLNSSRAANILDLDQERLTPVDFIQMQRMAARSGGGGDEKGNEGFQQYLHLSPNDVAFIPYETTLNFGAQVQSLAVEFAKQQEVLATLKKLVPRLGFNLYAGQGKVIDKWSAVAGTSVGGLADLAVPIIIAALIVLNTMLGSVYERVKEIHIFSSLGLAPNHIGTLFMAEAFVYAVLGAVFGYLVGQSVAMSIAAYAASHHQVASLNLNYSSVSAVISTLVVIATVMLSTIYPARKASQVATPAVERRWQLPEPVGDTLEIMMPFAVTGGQATALSAFLSEWFNAYGEYSTGDFVTEDVRTGEEDGPYGKGYCISLMAWLAPFDLGVSQQVELRTLATDMQDVYEIKLTVKRVSGDVPSWKRINRKFLDTLRKQFLIWRTLSSGDRDRYLGVDQSVEAPAATN